MAGLINKVVSKPFVAVIWLVGGVTLGLLGWSIFGSLASEVTGTGMLVRGLRMFVVEAKLGGTVKVIHFKVNSLVSPSQVVMSLDASQQAIQLLGAERQLQVGMSLATDSNNAGRAAQVAALSALHVAKARLDQQGPALRRRQAELKRLVVESNSL